MKKLYEEIIKEFDDDYCPYKNDIKSGVLTLSCGKMNRLTAKINCPPMANYQKVENFIKSALSRQLEKIVKIIENARKELSGEKNVDFQFGYRSALNDILDKLKDS